MTTPHEHHRPSSRPRRDRTRRSHVARWTTTAALVASITLLGATSVGATFPGDWEPLKSKVATNLDDELTSTVTLSLPAAARSTPVDVVFVLDGSTSSDADAITDQAAALIDELAADHAEHTEVGIVVFGGSVPILDEMPLTGLEDPTDVEALTTMITDQSYRHRPGRSGSNLDAGVTRASELLSAADRNTAAAQHIIILSDGAARMWLDDDDGDADAQTFTFYPSTPPEESFVLWNSMEDFRQRYMVGAPEFAPRTFGEVWAAGTGGTDIGAYAMNHGESQAATVTSPEIADSNTVRSDPDYFTSYEASTYNAARAIIAAAETADVTMVSYPYHPAAMFGVYIESFKAWLDSESHVDRYDTESLAPEEIFADLQSNLVHSLGAGSRVVDVMGLTDDYDFDFVNELDHLSVTVDGSALERVRIDDNTYGFGDDGTGGHRFRLVYHPDGTDGTSECFVWHVDAPVMIDEAVQLNYRVKLTDPRDEPGSYGEFDADGSKLLPGLHVNNSAVLHPTDSNGEPGEPLVYGRPTVSYSVPATAAPPDSGAPDPAGPDVRTQSSETAEEPAARATALGFTGAAAAALTIGALATIAAGAALFEASRRARRNESR